MGTNVCMNGQAHMTKIGVMIHFLKYEGDPRSNANPSVISSTFGISKNGLHVYYDVLSVLRNFISFLINHVATPVA